MKKILSRIICGALAVCIGLSMMACGEGKSFENTMVSGGKLVANGGFVAETENYVYFINGMPTSTDDNTYGVPVKGALMAADKADLSKTSVVVPKLFAATNYDQGIFIDTKGEFVYYGTPSTEKNAEGNIANNEMVFTRTSLDGKNTTEKLFTLNTLSVDYRIVEKDNVVYIVYYNATDKALVSFNTSTKAEDVIAKTDDKATEKSLASYKFIEEKDTDKVVVVYTVTLYSEEYSEDKADKEGYTRPTQSYNEVYMYRAGDVKAENAEVIGTKIAEGKNTDSDLDDVMYEIKLAKGGYLFLTETVNTKKKTYAYSLSDFTTRTEIKNDAFVAEGNLIVSLDEVYNVDTGAGVVYKSTLLEKDNAIKKKVVVSNKVATLLFVTDTDGDGLNDTLYYYNAAKQVARTTLSNIKADGSDLDITNVHETRVSTNTVNIDWYRPDVAKINGKDYMFYMDNSEFGASYIKCINLDAAVKSEDTDDDEKDDLFYLDEDAELFVAKMTNADKASIVTATINDFNNDLENGVLPMEKVDGTYKSKLYEDAKAIYDGITDKAVKDLISEDTVKMLDKYAEAVRVANLYAKLEGIEKCATKEAAVAAGFETKYNEIKADVEEFLMRDDATAIQALIENNLKAHYTRANEFFKPEEK